MTTKHASFLRIERKSGTPGEMIYTPSLAFFMAFFVLFASMPFQAESLEKTVRIAATNYPPYEFEQPEEGLRGFDVEVVEEAFRRAGMTAVVEFYPWARAVDMGKKGDIDALLSLTKLPEREEYLLFSEPISSYSLGCIVRANYEGPLLKTPEDLRGQHVGTMQNYVTAEMLQQLDIPHDLSPSDEIGLHKLADGRTDILFTSIENSLYLIKKMNLGGRFRWFVFEEKFFHLGFSRQHGEAEALARAFNSALQSVKEDGTYDAIHSKYRSEAQMLRIGATHYPPYEFEQPSDGRRGFDAEVVEEAFQRAGLAVRFEFYPWARALEMAKEGTLQGLITCRKTSERNEFFLFSDVLSTSIRIFLLRKDYDGPPLRQLADIKGMKAGMVKGYSSSDDLLQAGIEHDFSLNDEIALKKLADARIDVLVTNLENTQYLLRRLNLRDRFIWFEVDETNFHLCLSHQWPRAEQALTQFNQGLQSLHEDGTYAKIHRQYR